MFTGIVQGTVPVKRVSRGGASLRYTIELPDALRDGLALGASVAVDGVCQTVADLAGPEVSFDANQETLRVTTVSELAVGTFVNVERSARHGTEIGGHVVSGHVDGTVEIAGVEQSADNHVLLVRFDERFGKYVFNKGFVALNGASLTVSDLDESARTFRVYLIPETLRLTTFARKRTGDRLNLEIDRQTQVLVDTVERTLRAMMSTSAR